MQMVGTLGSTIIFVMALVSSIMVAICLVSYAAHCFLVIVDSTAAGMDEIPWPDEPFLDWLWKPPFLLGLISIWAIVSGGILFLLAPALTETWPGLIAVLFVAIWIFFPVSLYSSLSGHSVLYVLYWPLLRRLGRRIPELVLLYLLTAPLLAGGLWLFRQALTGGIWWLFLADVLLPAMLLVYARLLGRLGWLLASRTPLKSKARRAESAFKKMNIEVVDPWSFPEEEAPLEIPADCEGPAIKSAAGPSPARADKDDDGSYSKKIGESYGVMNDEQARQSWNRKRADIPREEGYTLAPALPSEQEHSLGPIEEMPSQGYAPAPLPTERPPERPPEPILREEQLRLERESPPPKFLFWSGVFSFPTYRRCIAPWVALSFWGLLQLIFLRMMASFGLAS